MIRTKKALLWLALLQGGALLRASDATENDAQLVTTLPFAVPSADVRNEMRPPDAAVAPAAHSALGATGATDVVQAGADTGTVAQVIEQAQSEAQGQDEEARVRHNIGQALARAIEKIEREAVRPEVAYDDSVTRDRERRLMQRIGRPRYADRQLYEDDDQPSRMRRAVRSAAGYAWRLGKALVKAPGVMLGVAVVAVGIAADASTVASRLGLGEEQDWEKHHRAEERRMAWYGGTALSCNWLAPYVRRDWRLQSHPNVVQIDSAAVVDGISTRQRFTDARKRGTDLGARVKLKDWWIPPQSRSIRTGGGKPASLPDNEVTARTYVCVKPDGRESQFLYEQYGDRGDVRLGGVRALTLQERLERRFGGKYLLHVYDKLEGTQRLVKGYEDLGALFTGFYGRTQSIVLYRSEA